jgi:ribonuclease T1
MRTLFKLQSFFVRNAAFLLALFVVLVSSTCFVNDSIAKGPQSPLSEASQVVATDLPKEALQTLALIRSGGPFPNEKDGVVFGNREKQLPKQQRGYYTEYTVRTPGAKNRGARRLVVGGEPQTSKEIYYTDDHYQSFKRVKQVDK